MAYPVYSHRFFGAAGFNGNAGYTVPAGYVAVVRDADVWINNGGSGYITFELTGQQGQIIAWTHCAAGAFILYQWQGRQVFNAGEIFSIVTIGGPADITVSGYLLSTP